MKKTTFKISSSVQEMERAIIHRMGIPRTVFHRWAIEYYLKYDRTIHPNLRIKTKKDPEYVIRDATEQIYLDEKDEEALLDIAEKYYGERKNIGTVLFQAVLTYCTVQAPVILGKHAVKKMIGYDEKLEDQIWN